MKMSTDENLLKTLTPSTLQVYTYLIKRNPRDVSLSEISKKLGLTKPTILHHIEKLKRAKLIEETANGYKLKQLVQVSIVRTYVTLFGKFLPRHSIILIVFGILFGLSIALPSPIETKIITSVLSILAVIIALREIKQYV